MKFLPRRGVFCVIPSRPVWAGGLKFVACFDLDDRVDVPPRVGGWIEIYSIESSILRILPVPPRVGGWIEMPHTRCSDRPCRVPPRVGGWIEIPLSSVIIPKHPHVPPRVGGWIEIPSDITDAVISLNVPPRVGGWIEISR